MGDRICSIGRGSRGSMGVAENALQMWLTTTKSARHQ